MLYKTEIDAKKFDLRGILNFIRKKLNEYNWAIFEFDGILSPRSKFDINKISNEAMKSKIGFQLAGDGLIALASDIEQTYDLILAGKRAHISEFENTDKWREENDLVIEIVDCGNWEIYSSDEKLLLAIKSKVNMA